MSVYLANERARISAVIVKIIIEIFFRRICPPIWPSRNRGKCWRHACLYAVTSIDCRQVLACVTAASPRKKSEERRLSLTVDNRVRGHVTFPGMWGKWYDWLLHYHANSVSLIGYNFRGFSTGGMRWDNLNLFDKSVVRVRAYFAQILSLTTATKISSTEGRVPHSKFELKYWRWTTEYPLTLPTFAGVASHYWRKEER